MRHFVRYAVAIALAAALTAVDARASDNAKAPADKQQEKPAPSSAWHLGKEKFTSPTGVRSEAGVGLSLGRHVMLQLNYARTASGPLMRDPNDDGVLARLRVGF